MNPQHPTRHCPPPPRTLAPPGSPQATSRHECFFTRTSLVLLLLQPAPPTLIRLPLPYSQHTSLHGHHPSSAHTHLLPKLSSFLSVMTCPSRPLPEGPLSLVHARPQACLQPLQPTPDMPFGDPLGPSGPALSGVHAGSSARLWLRRGQDQPWKTGHVPSS